VPSCQWREGGDWVAGHCIFDDSSTVQAAMGDAQAITSMHCEAITSMHCEAITSMHCEAITCVPMYCEDTHLLRGDCVSWRFALLIQRRGKERAKQSNMERESERGVGEVAKDTARGGW